MNKQEILKAINKAKVSRADIMENDLIKIRNAIGEIQFNKIVNGEEVE